MLHPLASRCFDLSPCFAFCISIKNYNLFAAWRHLIVFPLSIRKKLTGACQTTVSWFVIITVIIIIIVSSEGGKWQRKWETAADRDLGI